MSVFVFVTYHGVVASRGNRGSIVIVKSHHVGSVLAVSQLIRQRCFHLTKCAFCFFGGFFFAFPPTVVDAILQNAHVKWEMETSEAYRKSTEATTVKSTKLCPTGIHQCVVPTPVSGPCLKGPNISLSCSQNHSGPLKSAPLLLPAT